MTSAEVALQTAMEHAQSEFLGTYPEYSATGLLDRLRASEYERLDRLGHVYLDYTGGSLYAVSQLRLHSEQLRDNVFGNPHSGNPTSLAMTERIERARAYVLEYFNAPARDYLAIFTANASGALKHVGESYPFGPRSRYLLTFDNHNSVNGIREFARRKGASVTYLPVCFPELRIDPRELSALLDQCDRGANNLFAFPAQSNFSGVQHPLEMIATAHDAGWDVLLDAAAFVPTNPLDVDRWKPDFVSISFYKIFGYPTGVGCLLMRKSMFEKIRRPWFAGGTVQIASVQGDGHYLAKDAAAFEDGTIDYLSLPAIEIGLRHIAAIGMETIHTRVVCLTAWLLKTLSALKHGNGSALVDIHGPQDTEGRGGTISFNLIDPSGHAYDIRRVEEMANHAGISLRTGCFCNPGAGEVAFGLGPEQIGPFFQQTDGMSFQELRARMRQTYSKEIGAMRVSLGLASNFADVFRFVEFTRGLVDKSATDIGEAETASACDLMRDSS